jgi:hypothetical protein
LALQRLMSDRRRQMRLSHAIRTQQGQPAIWSAGISSDPRYHCAQTEHKRVEGRKSLVAHGIEVAHPRELPRGSPRPFLLFTLAGKEHTKIGVTERDGFLDVSGIGTGGTERLLHWHVMRWWSACVGVVRPCRVVTDGVDAGQAIVMANSDLLDVSLAHNHSPLRVG